MELMNLVPKLYRRMLDDGALDMGPTRPDWWQANKKRHLEMTPAYLALNDVEWLREPKIYKKPGHWKSEYTFLQFAETQGGDPWSWSPTFFEGMDAAVVLPWGDMNGTVYAPHFEAFLYRSAIEGCELMELNSFGTREETARVQRGAAEKLAAYLRPSWAKTLREIVARPLVAKKKESECGHFLTSKEARAIIVRDLAFPRLDEEFQHMD